MYIRILFVPLLFIKQLHTMNKFYGKNINEMTFGELTLLSVDIQITSFIFKHFKLLSFLSVSCKKRSIADQVLEGLMLEFQFFVFY